MENGTLSNVLQELADKLGTTTEYLWEALLRQAPISGVVDLFIYGGAITLSVIGHRGVKAFINADPDDEDRKFVWVIYWGGVFIFGLLFSINLPLTFAAFFNSEYWALKEILD